RRRHTRSKRDWSSDVCSSDLERFFELLRTQSQNNVASLASEIRGNLSRVQDRIAPINASLARSEFNPGTYLDIVVLNNQNDKAQIGRASCRERGQRADGAGEV